SATLHFSFFFFPYSADLRDLHSFPTRRSSDLALIDGRLEINPDAMRVAKNLGRRLVQSNHEGALTAPGPFGDELQGHDALARARDPDDERRARDEIPPVYHLVEAGEARRNPRGR